MTIGHHWVTIFTLGKYNGAQPQSKEERSPTCIKFKFVFEIVRGIAWPSFKERRASYVLCAVGWLSQTRFQVLARVAGLGRAGRTGGPGPHYLSLCLPGLGCRFGVTPVTSEIIKRNKKRDIISLKFQ